MSEAKSKKYSELVLSCKKHEGKLWKVAAEAEGKEIWADYYDKSAAREMYTTLADFLEAIGYTHKIFGETTGSGQAMHLKMK
jgi:hypothetical protein